MRNFIICLLFLICTSICYSQMPNHMMQEFRGVKRYPAVTRGLIEHYPLNNDNGSELLNYSVMTKVTASSIVQSPGKYQEHCFYSPGSVAGTGEYATKRTNQIHGLTAYTISFWYRTNIRRTDVAISSYSQTAFGFYAADIDASGKLYIANQIPGQSGTTWTTEALSTNVWYYITYTRNGTVCYGYVNGALSGSQSQAAEERAFNQTVPFLLGGLGYFFGGFPNFNGNLQDVSIYGVALSSNEVWQLYKGFTQPP